MWGITSVVVMGPVGIVKFLRVYSFYLIEIICISDMELAGVVGWSIQEKGNPHHLKTLP